ncbi:MAG: hypothetical protein HY276_07340 [Ignavibacteriales bacterium]|nr:hypothetical protein [Ignavibacteriales bacterium]
MHTVIRFCCTVIFLFASISASVSQLQQNRTYYVSPTGSDSNDGLCLGQAFLTIQKAVDVASIVINNGYNITIQLANGTYTTGAVLKRYSGSGVITIQGNSTYHDSVLVYPNGYGFYSENRGVKWIIKDLKVQTSGVVENASIFAEGGFIEVQGVNFGIGAGDQLRAERGGRIRVAGNYTISGGAYRHVHVRFGGEIELQYVTVTLTGTPNFSVFVEVSACASGAFYSLTFSGSATGSRYRVDVNGVISTFGGGANYFPGNAAGTTATGGQYN